MCSHMQGQGQQDGSVSEDACCQACRLELDPQNPHDREIGPHQVSSHTLAMVHVFLPQPRERWEKGEEGEEDEGGARKVI